MSRHRKNLMTTPLSIGRAADLFALLADDNRLHLLLCLSRGKMQTVSELGLAAGVNVDTASRHLCLLRLGGLVDVRTQGRNRLYRLRKRALRDLGGWLTRRLGQATAPGFANPNGARRHRGDGLSTAPPVR